MNEKVINYRKGWVAQRLNLKAVPKKDIEAGNDWQKLHENIEIRLGHLADTLIFLKRLYECNKDYYNQDFLAFVGDKIIRSWPNKDIVFTSKAFENMKNSGDKEKIHYEHFTPISFFRDLFAEPDLTRDDIFFALKKYYRVVYILGKENSELEKKGFKTTRPHNAYELCEIEISDKEKWEKIYSEIDLLHK